MNKKPRNKGRYTNLKMVLAIVLILSTMVNLVMASGYPEMEYRGFLNWIFTQQTGKPFAQPTPVFDIKSSDGQNFTAAPSGEVYDHFNGTHGMKDIPVSATIPVGTTLELFDKSLPGADAKKINAWDWQTYYWDTNGKSYPSSTKLYGTQNVKSFKADKAGDIFIFLNIADDYVAKQKGSNKRLPFDNWSSHGNWRTTGRKVTGTVQITDWYFTVIRIKVTDDSSDMIMKELELIDPDTGRVLEKFERTVDNLDPMNIKKQKTITTNSNPMNASVLKRNKKYIVRAKYQFISFEEGEFDISKPGTMNEKQKALSTGVTPNELDVGYAYDGNWNKSGVFDKQLKEKSKDKGNVELKNLETASFEWEYEVPEEAKEFIKIAGIVPKSFANKKVDDNDSNNWSAIYAKLAPNDLGMNKNVKLVNENNEAIRTYKKGKDLRLIT